MLQRGNPGQRIFQSNEDYREYIELVAAGCKRARVTVLGYCLLPKQVQLILVPPNAKALRNALGEAHRRFTRSVNMRRDRKGGLFRGRFASFPMDKPSLPLVMRFVEQSAVRSRAAKSARDWRWSSAGVHLKGKPDGFVDVKPIAKASKNWKDELAKPIATAELKAIAASENTGRPFGSPAFVAAVEKKLGRTLARQRPGPKPKAKSKRKS
ncbi:MAG: transposase [Alphaproteobacteria bacterium]|nr:transposase [Alphaproteobacteria bacterium]